MQRAPRAGRRDRDGAPVLRARVEPGPGRAGGRAARRRRARLLPPPSAHAAPLPPAPALRARGARSSRRRHVTGRVGLPAPVHRADLGDRGDAARQRRAGLARGGPQPPPGPRPRGGEPRPPPGRDRGAAPGTPHARATCSTRCCQDKATKDRLRSYPHWLASRNLANEASDESVEALIEAVRSRYELARRWYRLKARPARARPARATGTGWRR